MQARAALALVVQREEARDLARELPVLLRMGTHATPLPAVEAGARDAVAPTQGAHASLRVVRDGETREEGDDVARRAEQNRMAFFKRSCSSWSSAYSRSSCCSRASSRVCVPVGTVGAAPLSRPSRASFRFKDRLLFIANALKQHRIGLEETGDGVWSIYLSTVLLARLDERDHIIRG